MLFMFPCRISWSFVLFCFVLHTVPNTLSISSRGPSVTEQHHYSSSLLSVEPFQMKIMSVAVLGESSGQYEIRGLPKFFFFFFCMYTQPKSCCCSTLEETRGSSYISNGFCSLSFSLFIYSLSLSCQAVTKARHLLQVF